MNARIVVVQEISSDFKLFVQVGLKLCVQKLAKDPIGILLVDLIAEARCFDQRQFEANVALEQIVGILAKKHGRHVVRRRRRIQSGVEQTIEQGRFAARGLANAENIEHESVGHRLAHHLSGQILDAAIVFHFECSNRGCLNRTRESQGTCTQPSYHELQGGQIDHPRWILHGWTCSTSDGRRECHIQCTAPSTLYTFWRLSHVYLSFLELDPNILRSMITPN